MGRDLDQLDERSRQMVLSAPSLLSLTESLHGLRERHGRIATSIAECSQALLAALDRCKEAQQCVDKSQKMFSHIQSELQELQRPVGCKIENVKGMLDTCQVDNRNIYNWLFLLPKRLQITITIIVPDFLTFFKCLIYRMIPNQSDVVFKISLH